MEAVPNNNKNRQAKIRGSIFAGLLRKIPSAALFWPALVLSACGVPEEKPSRGPGRPDTISATAESVPGVTLKYARGFSLARRGGTLWAEVRKPWQGAATRFRYRLVPRDSLPAFGAPGEAGGDAEAETLTLGVPARRVLTMTTTNLPHFAALGRQDALVGVGNAAFVCDETVKARLAEGTLRGVGDEASVDAEAAVDLRPDLVLAFAVASWSNPGLKKLKEAGLPVVLEAAYMEETPLGRAEWIKFTAAFLGPSASAAADSAFAAVDSAYGVLAALARTAARRPTVVVNAPFRGSWWMPGGRSYVARFLADAGADYLWADDTTEGSLSLDLEAVLARAGNADYWLNPGPWRSLADGKKRDPRHALFRSFRDGRVWNNDRVLCGAGNDFFEKGSARPDWVLADLIALFHPELLPGHRFRWYRRLEPS